MRKRIRLEHVSEFKYFGCVLGKSCTDECSRKVTSGSGVADAIKSLVDARSLHLECARVLHESLLVPIFTYVTERKEKERFRIRAVKMNNFSSLRGIRRMDKFRNTQIRKLCGLTKGVNKRID